MKRSVVQPEGHPRPAGHYSHGVVAEGGRTLYLAGQTPLDEAGGLVCPGDAEGQARRCYENIRRVVEAAGGRMEDTAKITVFVTSLDHRAAVGKVRKEFFPGDPPASTFLVVSSLARPDFLVEIEAIVPLP